MRRINQFTFCATGAICLLLACGCDPVAANIALAALNLFAGVLGEA